MANLFNNQDPGFYIQGIIAGDMAILSRAITLVESGIDSHHQVAQKIIDGLVERTGKSFRLGITGVPGAGKSTFIESFGKTVLEKGHKLAVLAIDPSSTKSKGSILGDKTRMETLSTHKNVFIRPSPSSGTLGGVTRSSYETMLLCEAAGFDFIIVETVGVGQSEVEVGKITDFFLLLMLAGAGDELQGIKRGIMEMADAVVITKADGGNLEKAKAARSEYAHAMHLLSASPSGWIPKTLLSSGVTGLGMNEVYEMIESYRLQTNASGYFSAHRTGQQFELFSNALDEQLRQRFHKDQRVMDHLKEVKEKMSQQNIQPYTLAKEFLDSFFGKG